MMRYKVLPLCVVLSAALSAHATIIDVVNNGFERGRENWEGRGIVTDDEHHTGSKSMAIESGCIYQPPGKKRLIWIDPNHDYRIRVWIKSKDCKPNGVTVMVACLGGPGEKDTKWLGGGWLKGATPKFVHDNGASPAILATGGTHDWQQFEAAIPSSQLGSQTHALLIYLRHDARTTPEGVAYFDDLEVEQLPSGSVEMVAGPIFRNGGFESGLAPWSSGSAKVVHDHPASGKSCVVLEKGFTYQQADLQGGKHYRISMKIRTEGILDETGFVQYSLKGIRGWAGPIRVKYPNRTEQALFVTGGTHDWKIFSAVIATPKQAQGITLYLRTMGSGGRIYYDDVVMKPVDEPATTPQELRKSGMAPAQPFVEDRDFAREALQNTDFSRGDESWVIDGVAETIRKDGGNPDCLKLIRGSAIQGLKLTPNAKYRISARIRTLDAADTSASARLKYRGPRRLRKEHTQSQAIVTGGTHGWQDFSIVVQVPKQANEALVTLDKKPDDGVVWFDRVAVEATDDPVVGDAERQRNEQSRLFPPPVNNTSAPSVLAAILRSATRRQPSVVELENGGDARYRIHVGSPDHAVERYAAEELAAYLERISGADFTPFSYDANPRRARLIVVGRHNTLTDRLCPDIPYATLGDDGFVIRMAGPHIVIAGNTPRGTLYGVYHFLDLNLGVRWFSPEYTHVPKRVALSIAPPNETQVPRFSYREIFARDGDDPRYRAHNRLNGNSHHRSARKTPPELGGFNDSWGQTGGHNFHKIVPQKTLSKTHPEYFAGGQLAMMNPEVRRIAVENLSKKIGKKDHYADFYWGFSQEDRGWAPDAASRAFADEHGGALSAPLLDMTTDVAEGVRRALPGAKLATFAYQWSYRPPTGMSVPDFVIMTLAPIHADFGQPLNGPHNRQIAKDTEQWASICDHIVVWDYITNFGSYIQPHPNYTAFCESIRWLATLPSVKGYFGQSSYGTSGAEFAELRTWVASRLMWNPDQDPSALIDEFVTGYYGKAAPYIRKYISLMEASVQQTGAPLRIRTQVTAPYFSFDAMRQADDLFAQAERAIADDYGFQNRVRTARIGVDYVILLRRADFSAEAVSRGIDWSPDTERRFARFERYTSAMGINKYGEGAGTIASLITAMQIERRVPPVPDICKGMPVSDWIDFQDLALRRYAGEVVADPLASDGGAIKLPGKIPAWAVQLKLDNLPPEGQWRLYAVVRIDRGVGADAAKAFSCGIYPPFGNVKSPTVAEMSDGAYHVIELPGEPAIADAGRGVWIAPPNSRAIEALYVDRIFAVKVGKP